MVKCCGLTSKMRNKTKMSILETFIQHCIGSYGHSNLARKTNKSPNWKRRRKTVTVCGWHGTLHRKILRCFKKYFVIVFKYSVMPDFLWPSGLQNARLPCPTVSPGVCSNSCPLSQSCHPAISFYVAPFSCSQSFPTLESFPMSQLSASGGQIIGASASVLPINIQGWFPLGLTGLISLLSKGLSRVFSSTTVWKHQFFSAHPSYGSTLTSVHDYRKNYSFD